MLAIHVHEQACSHDHPEPLQQDPEPQPLLM